jgi:hypothetical protein
MFRVVQPYGRDKAWQSTISSEHVTAADAFAEMDRLKAQMVCAGAPRDAIELIAVDPEGQIVGRPQAPH